MNFRVPKLALFETKERCNFVVFGTQGEPETNAHPSAHCWFILDGEAIMKRERVLQIFLTVLGILFLALLYPLYLDLWHAKWLLVMHDETDPMFLSFFIALGPFLLIAARDPRAHRLLILFAAWWNLAHATVMAVETVQAWNRGVHRNFADVVIVSAIGLILLVLSPTRQERGVTPAR